MELPARKPTRLAEFDCSTPGAYFITICTQNRKPILGSIVGGGAFDAPHICLTSAGRTAQQYILSSNKLPNIAVDKFVIMPNHIHMILLVNETNHIGTSKAPSPTNATIPHFVSAFKRFCHRDIGDVIFQRSYHDHIVRSEADYRRIWEYIDTNPVKWREDCFYCE